MLARVLALALRIEDAQLVTVEVRESARERAAAARCPPSQSAAVTASAPVEWSVEQLANEGAQIALLEVPRPASRHHPRWWGLAAGL